MQTVHHVLQASMSFQGVASRVLTQRLTFLLMLSAVFAACAELIVEQWTKGCSEENAEHILRTQLTPHVIRDKRSQISLLITAKAASKQ